MAVSQTRQTMPISKGRQEVNSSALFNLRSESEEGQGPPETVNRGGRCILVTIAELKQKTKHLKALWWFTKEKLRNKTTILLFSQVLG